MNAINALMTGLIDYAGLFPPARLSMQAALEEFTRSHAGEHRAILGRFVCPALRLEELSRAGAPLMPGTFATSGYREMASSGELWRISAILDTELEASLSAIDAFNARHSREDNGLAVVDCVEIKIASPTDIDTTLDILPADLYPHFEFPISGDCRGFVAALAGEQASAKIRTGGLTPDLIPKSSDIARFLEACAAAAVPFKATAGLHHPVRSDRVLDSTPDAASGRMHGFMNVFLGAAAAHLRRWNASHLVALLDEAEASHFVVSEATIEWRSRTGSFSASADELRNVRQAFAFSFGSCSFDEPIADLQSLGAL